AFANTVTQFNVDAANGHDPAFGKGSRAYNRYQGDAQHGPNPCVAPIETGPFYAIKMVIGDLGTYAGIRTDAHARALDGNGEVIHGLYAAGNDMASIMGGNYPGAGITLGPALTFGYIAGRHLAGKPVAA
ncbi:FAD-binding protein, partial [Tardiphaga sp.]|uniref:FAD-binding protein n=1 Tax=Tardiphaga sp. TaxID=1926292 RepID=UPI0037D9D6E3